MSSIVGCALILSFIALQMAGGPLYDVYGLRPDFPAIALALIAISLRPLGVFAIALLAGAILDLSSAGFPGTRMTACLLLAFFILHGRKTGWSEDRTGRALLLCGGVLLAVMVPHLASWTLDGRHLNSALLLAGSAGYSLLFTWPLHRLLQPILQWSMPPGQRPYLIPGRSNWQRPA